MDTKQLKFTSNTIRFKNILLTNQKLYTSKYISKYNILNKQWSNIRISEKI